MRSNILFLISNCIQEELAGRKSANCHMLRHFILYTADEPKCSWGLRVAFLSNPMPLLRAANFVVRTETAIVIYFLLAVRCFIFPSLFFSHILLQYTFQYMV